MTAPPEQFPKSAAITGDKLGAWLRLFGMHHTRPHFTRVWSGDPWLDEPWLQGSAATDAIMSIQLGPPPPVAREDDEPVVVEKGRTMPRADFSSSGKNHLQVCVDLDGVLARYDGWHGKTHFGNPLPGALEFLRELRSFARVIILSSRSSGDGLEDNASFDRSVA